MEKTTANRIQLPKAAGYRCFACGTHNPIGLQMSFYLEGATVRSDITLSEHHCGWENIAHGGIISTVLDEVMGWTVLTFKRDFFVTKSIEVRFLKPVMVETPLMAIGNIESESPRGGCRVKGALVGADGVKLASAKAEMTFLSENRLQFLPERYREEMLNIFREMDALVKDTAADR